MKKFIMTACAVSSLAAFSALPAMADKPTSAGGGDVAAVNNTNADANACWGQDRSFYASEGFFALLNGGKGNMDIKQSFPPAGGTIADQKAAWIAQYCEVPA
jgi:hypothetical protein